MANAPLPHTADAPGMETWQRLASDSLKSQDISRLWSKTRDGIAIAPLYPARTDTTALVGRGPDPWTIVQPVDDPDLDRANAQALADLNGGATGLVLRFAAAPAAGGFGLQPTAEAMHAALEGVDFGAVHLRVDPHPAAIDTALVLRDMVAKSGLAPESADIAFGLDPIGPAAFFGNEPAESRLYAECFQQLRASGHRGVFAELDARVFHDAGATEAQELAAVVASAVWWLRALDGHVAASDALPFFGATLAVDRDQFMSIAKLRAGRLLWSRLLELCSAPETPLTLHTETSRRMMTRADPHGNVLRTTIAAFAAAVGGADSITVLPHTAALGLADPAARALARNVQHLLIEEAHLHKVADPSAGSGAVEALTDALAERAWAEFQMLEREGGIAESLQSGAFASRIAEARDALKVAFERGEVPLVGSTIYRASTDVAPVDATSRAWGGLPAMRLEEFAARAV